METKLVCIGDSLTEGYGIHPDDCWTALLAKDLGLKIVNSGISGDTTGGMLARFRSMVVAYRPSHVIIMGGANDLFFGLSDAQIFSNIHSMTRLARHYGIIAIIGIPSPYFEEKASGFYSPFLDSSHVTERVAQFRDHLRSFFKEDGLDMIDFARGMTPEMVLEDGLHPNPEGHALMKENARQALQHIL